MVRPFRQIRIDAMQRFFRSSGKTKEDCASIDDKYLNYQARLLVENVRLLTILPEQLQKSVRLEGEQHIRRALQDGQGVLLVCTHVGNWLLAPALLSTLGYEVSAIAYEIPISAIEDHMQQIWKRYSISIAHAGRDSVRAARKALGLNNVLIMAFDASVRPSKNEWMPFGNIAISADPAPARIASLLNVPILRMRICPKSESETSLIIQPDRADPGNPMPTWLAELHEEVSDHPELWWPWSFVRLGDRSSLPHESLHARNRKAVTA